MRVSAVKGIFFVVLHSVTLRAENRAVTVHLLALPENQSTITLKGGQRICTQRGHLRWFSDYCGVITRQPPSSRPKPAMVAQDYGMYLWGAAEQSG